MLWPPPWPAFAPPEFCAVAAPHEAAIKAAATIRSFCISVSVETSRARVIGCKRVAHSAKVRRTLSALSNLMRALPLQRLRSPYPSSPHGNRRCAVLDEVEPGQVDREHQRDGEIGNHRELALLVRRFRK